MKRAVLIGILLVASFAQVRAQKAFPGIDSAEKVSSTLVTAIPISQSITPSTPFQVAIHAGDGAKFAKVTPKPFIVTVAPQVENATTPIEEFECSAVSGDTLTLITRSPATGHNLAARTWATGSYIGVRLVGEYIKSLQDTLNWLITSGPGTGKTIAVTALSPLTMNGVANGSDSSYDTVAIPQATGSQSGFLSSTDWTTFNSKQSTLSATAPLTVGGTTISMPAATTSQSGYLSSTDWNTFNGKQNAISVTSGDSGLVLSNDGTNLLWQSAGSGTVTSVNVSPGTSGLTFSGGPIVKTGTISISGGQLGIGFGGTGGATKEQAQANLFPDSTGQTGKTLSVLAGGGFGYTSPAGGGTVTSFSTSLSGLSVATATTTPALSGTLGISSGGTGQTTASAAFTALVPSMTGNSGKFLTNNGTSASWATVSAGSTLDSIFPSNGITLLDAGTGADTITTKGTVGLTVPVIVANGGTGKTTLTAHSLQVGNGTGALTQLGVATNGQIPIGSTGADPTLATITGTANQINVTNGAASITLSTPQSIATTSSPTFNGLTLTNPLPVSSGGLGNTKDSSKLTHLADSSVASHLADSSKVVSHLDVLDSAVRAGSTPFADSAAKVNHALVLDSAAKAGTAASVTGTVAIANGGTG
ncbi:hypothetical protein KGP36_01550, partial [Patescibacteria group bacterium]|nr:hypothetical protein [Patescibacteria group bacterium]